MYGACAGRIQGIVSIQLLLLFYLTPAIEKGILLRFNTTFVTVLLTYLYRLHYSVLPFQYNFCYCSMPLIPLFIKGHLRLNKEFGKVKNSPDYANTVIITL